MSTLHVKWPTKNQARALPLQWPHFEQKQEPVEQHRRAAVKLMMFGVIAMMDLAALGVLETVNKQPLSHFNLILTCLICGSAGMVVNIAFWCDNLKTAQQVAQHAVGSVLTAAIFGPLATVCVARAFQTETDVIVAMAVSGAIGLGGSYIVKNYGPAIADAFGRWGLKRVKDVMPGDDK